MSDTIQKPLVSVGICTRNRAHSILTAVESVLANTYTSIELLIVDQSTDGETAKLLADHPDARVCYVASQQRGTCRSRNTVLDQARGDIVLMTDDDCVVPTDWIQHMVDTFADHPNAALVFSRVDAGDYNPATSFVPVFLCEREYVLASLRQTAPHGIGASMGMRRAIVRQIGGFDKHLGPGGEFNSGEDQDLCYRLIRAGFSVAITPRTTVIHNGARSFQDVSLVIKRDVTASGAIFAKHLRVGNALIAFHIAGISVTWLRESLSNLLQARPPRGLRRIWWLYHGMWHARNAPLDSAMLTFSLSDEQAAAYDSFRVKA